MQEVTGRAFPSNPRDQLRMGINAVFASWYNDRAVAYRRENGIPEDWGTAANVQAMVFGNRGEDSGTGVVFTRDPATGEKYLFGEFLTNAQGEDVVAGIRDPQPIHALEELMPEVYAELVKVCQTLEEHFRDMQDIEFTIQDRTLYLLQTRSGKRTAPAAVRVAVEMAHEGLIDKREAVLRVGPGPGGSSPPSDDRSPGHGARCSARACRPLQAPPVAASSSRPRKPCVVVRAACGCCWCAMRPHRRTSVACTLPRVF